MEIAGRMFSRVHHVAVVVRDIDAALATYRDRLGLPVELVLPIASDGVTIAFLTVGESKVELVVPTDPDTGVARFLESRGEGFHHVCFETADVDAMLDDLAAQGVELIDRQARRGAEGPVAFLHPRSCHGVLVELIEAPRRAGLGAPRLRRGGAAGLSCPAVSRGGCRPPRAVAGSAWATRRRGCRRPRARRSSPPPCRRSR